VQMLKYNETTVLSSDLARPLLEWPGTITWNVAMADHTTLRAGGRAMALVTVHGEDELGDLLRLLYEYQIPWQILGRGSNLLVSSDPYQGVFIRLQGRFAAIRRQEESVDNGSDPVIVAAGGGCSLARLVAWCTGHALGGLEFMVGIPGTVGGAVRMNAGAWGREVGECISSLSLMDRQGNRFRVSASDLLPSYRKMAVLGHDLRGLIVTEASFRLQRGRQKEILSRCIEYLAGRRKKQPTGSASAGSFFRNPSGDSAGRLIEAAGLKGMRCGDAVISSKHANFLINRGRASADDIIRLMRLVQEKVYNRFGIHLEPEVHIL